MKLIRYYWNSYPLYLIMGLAIFVRLLAVFFAKGFGMHDDHFLVVEIQQSWVDGLNIDNWLPSGKPTDQASGHSFFYPSFQFAFFYLMKILHIGDPQMKMYILRFLHGAFSLITVFYGFKIAEKISNTESAKIVGLLLAAFWLMPWASVHNLVEIVCIPFMIYSLWIIINKYDHPKHLGWFFLSGLLLGIAFSIRFQTLVFTGGVGIALLVDKRWKEMFVVAFGYLISVVLTQCIPDMILWGYPFAELRGYYIYNM
ncbi:MAG: glycosyltransferase family 39 protein, partial [Bacteroidetes bacterium]|nr:glycosyltransferase family 39 protein [Bacteroidota bacterium]